MKKTLFILFFISFYPSHSQSQKIDSLYANYFQNTRELPYVHLNKTTFLEGEEIWFQAYVIEQNSNKLHATTSNLYISIFDDSGNQKEQHLIHIKDGVGFGNILIDSTFTKNTYHLKASTNWMRNFDEDNSFTQKISIISNQKNSTNKLLSQDKFFEFKLFPEGGHLLANTINNIGILIKDINNEGVKIIDGKIKTDKGSIIAKFSTNSLGFANINMLIKENEIYSFEATLPNGTILTEKTTIPEEIGITLNTKIIQDSFVLNILTNEASLQQLNSKKYKVLIHNTRVFKNIFFEFNSKNKTYTLFLNKKDIPTGINIITIFNENNVPILERMIFNDFEDFSEQLHISNSNPKNDSIVVSYTNKSSKKIFLSSSFLPLETKAYKPNNSINSHTLLKPYVRGYIENPQYYFKNNYEDLDLLLLTQGWSKYSWDNIFNNSPKNNFKFEIGIDVKFHLNKPLRKKQSIIVYSPKNNIIREIPPNNNPFSIENSFIKKNSTIEFSSKQPDISLEVRPFLSYSNSKILDNLNADHLNLKYATLEEEEPQTFRFKSFIKETEVLDEVVVIGKKKPDNPTVGVATSFRKLDVKNMIHAQNTLIDFIRPLWRDYRYTKRPLNIFYLNGEDITDRLLVLLGISMDEVREVRMGTSIFGFSREMHIFTYSTKELNISNRKAINVKFPVGFKEEKEYYSPKFASYTNSIFKEFGAVFWQPNLVIEANSSLNIKIPTNYQKEAKVFTEGISETGELISKTNLIYFD